MRLHPWTRTLVWNRRLTLLLHLHLPLLHLLQHLLRSLDAWRLLRRCLLLLFRVGRRLIGILFSGVAVIVGSLSFVRVGRRFHLRLLRYVLLRRKIRIGSRNWIRSDLLRP